MKPELLEKYGGRVPRYTSYPTANHFGPEVGADAYRAWLAALPPSAPLSLYLHVPFCGQLCWYCGCHTTVVNSQAPVADYLDLLSREIDLVAGTIGGVLRMSHIHWGGGTPTILTSAQFSEMSERLRQRFRVGSDTEIGIEIDPRGFTREMAKALAGEGVTRASLGVQDMDPLVQVAINRIQPYEVTAAAVDHLRAEGIGDINLDLIYGLPRQSVDSILATVDMALALAPDQIALFGYAHVPWMKRHQALMDEAALPGTRGRWALYWVAAGRLVERGMVPVGLDHFAAPGSALARQTASHDLHRNFQGYTTDDATTLIGFGASAIGTLPQGYVQNAAKISDYRAAISAGRLATARGRTVDAEDALRRDVISALMCDLTADVGAICRAHGRKADALDGNIAALAPLASDGIVTLSRRRVTVMEDARPLVRSVCAAFDAYLADTETPRHAQAV